MGAFAVAGRGGAKPVYGVGQVFVTSDCHSFERRPPQPTATQLGRYRLDGADRKRSRLTMQRPPVDHHPTTGVVAMVLENGTWKIGPTVPGPLVAYPTTKSGSA